MKNSLSSHDSKKKEREKKEKHSLGDVIVLSYPIPPNIQTILPDSVQTEAPYLEPGMVDVEDVPFVPYTPV
jgi:hypothetical protein